MTLKKLIGQLHLWLGLASGLVVFIVGITGCCYVFIEEIQNITEPWQSVKEQPRAYLLPSNIRQIASDEIHGKQVGYVSYTPEKAAYAGAFGKDYSYGIYINPYTGKVQHVKNFKEKRFDFFSFVLDGHLNLWLPYKIGRPIVDAGVLVFVILLISGLVLWWPKNWSKVNRDKSFKIKWGARFKRLNYDLHNVPGFYMMLVLLVIAFTGLVYSYGWFARSLYWATSGGNLYPEYEAAVSDTTKTAVIEATSIDSLWLLHTYPSKQVGSSVSFPGDDKKAVIEIRVNHQPGSFYKQDIFDYDRHTLQPLKGQGLYVGKYADASAGDRIGRMNYDIHVGQIGGLPTKILAFFASLICASLPVTGFYIWWGKRRKKGKGKRREKVKRKRKRGQTYRQKRIAEI